MGYSTDSEMVRVDFFKPSGKWYTTEAVKWTGDYEGLIDKAYDDSLKKHLKTETGYRLTGMIAVCLEPYNKNAYPIMTTINFM